MKIYFGLGYLEEKPIKLAKNWKKIKHNKLIGPTYNQYLIFKLLENNKYFWKEIFKSRKKLGLPKNGLSWSLIKSYKTPKKVDKNQSLLLKIINNNFFSNINKEFAKIKSTLILHPYVLSELHDLIMSNFVFTYPEGPIDWYSSEYNEESDELIEDVRNIKNPQDICIYCNEKITKNQLIRYIKTNWPHIDKLNKKLPSPKSYTLSEKDKKIFYLRISKKLSFEQITNQIIEEFDKENINGCINEDSVKTSFHRVQNKINSVALPKK